MACRVSRRQLAAAFVPLWMATAACDWPWRHDMADQPSRSASAGARPPGEAAVSIAAAPAPVPDVAESQLHNPIASDAPTEPGRRLYTVYCEPCHGTTGRGNGPIARYFQPPIRDLTTTDVQRHSDGWLYAVITRGTEHMPRSAYELRPIDRWQTVHFLRTFGGRER